MIRKNLWSEAVAMPVGALAMSAGDARAKVPAVSDATANCDRQLDDSGGTVSFSMDGETVAEGFPTSKWIEPILTPGPQNNHLSKVKLMRTSVRGHGDLHR